MLDEVHIRELVQEALDLDRTPEEVCSEFPELLHDVRERCGRLRMVQAQIDVLFPPGRSRGDAANALCSPDEALPRIPSHDVSAVVGRGGVGVVYRARHLKLNRDVAVKMLLAGEYASPRELERFMLEAEAVASLRHPNIVQVHDVGELDGRPYFTMEFVEGGSLAERLAGTPQPATMACTMMITLTEAMQVAHDGEIIHRDLKPSNVLLTADGIPKITDFGLARRLHDGASITASGIVLGTPSYMAPEQVQGSARAIGPAVDIYALGAILYEMLTGRPPFRAESALATQMQVVTQEPVPPSRLNAEVPLDLETICLKCLHKDPERRYASAAGLAEDLRRFQRREPIAARRTGPLERALKWVRRRPAQAAALAGGSLLAFAVLGAVLWLGLQRAATERAVREDLREVALRERASDWIEARTALERAKARIGDGGSKALRELVEQSERDLDLVARLDAIRLHRAAVVEGRFDLSFNKAHADGEYEAAFRAAGWGSVGDDPAIVAARVAGCDIRDALVAALDDWAICATHAADRSRQDWLLDVARRADPDPTGWRLRVRDTATWKDWHALVDLARTVPHGDPSLPCLVALAERLADAGGDAIPLLEQVQKRHPDDFWANFTLGDALRENRPGEAIRYYQAALALRPDAAVARNNLGWVLALDGRIDEAIEQFREALRLDPVFAHARSNLGNSLALAGRNAEAIDAYRQAAALDPKAAVVRANLAKALAEEGRMDEAFEEAQQALALDPELATAHINLGLISMMMGRVDEAIDACRRALDLDPEAAKAHSCLCNALRVRGRLDEAIEHGEQAVRIDPVDSSIRNNLGSALAVGGRLDEAIEHFREAARIHPTQVQIHTNLGNALGLKGELDLAIEQFQEALRLAPDSAQANGSLGQALMGRGSLREARDALSRSLELFPEAAPQHAECRGQLERCERLIALEDRIPALLEGRDEPASGAEFLELAMLCRLQERHALAASWYADAFALEPSLAEEPRTNNRYDAACCAALAACGRGNEATELGEEERAQLRELAHEWLQAELATHAETLGRGSAPSRAFAQRSLTRWREDPDLAGVRDTRLLSTLSADERETWIAFWEEVHALLEPSAAR